METNNTNPEVATMETTKITGKPIKSSDPRKRPIMAALKLKSGGTKVTSVTEVRPGVFAGTCMNATTGKGLGRHEVTAEEAGIVVAAEV